MTKNELRKNILKIRSNMSLKDVEYKSEIIYNSLLKMHRFINAKNVFCYLDFNNEVKTNQIIEYCFKTNKNVYVPYIIDSNMDKSKSPDMVPIKINKQTEFINGKYGIKVPKGEKNKTKTNIDIDIDIVIVPGVAFDLFFNRIGFGKGYYDNFFMKSNSKYDKIALSYEFQIIDKLPSEKHDIKMDNIITEKNIYI